MISDSLRPEQGHRCRMGKTREVPGFLLENEARFVGLLAACTPAEGLIVEIGSFKGRSTVMLASVAAHYGLGPVVAIDPHNFNLSTTSTQPGPSTVDDFLRSLHTAGGTGQVEFHHAFSKDVGKSWSRPIRLLWNDGDHSYTGAKTDFDRFSPYVNPHGIVALHDSLNSFPGPIRVFVEDMLRSQKYGGRDSCIRLPGPSIVPRTDKNSHNAVHGWKVGPSS